MSAEPTKPATPTTKQTLRQRVRRWGWAGFFFVKMLPGELRFAWKTWGELRRAVKLAREQAAAQRSCGGHSCGGRSCGRHDLIPAKRTAGWRWRRLSYLVRVGLPTIIKAKVTCWVLQVRMGWTWGQQFMETRARLRHSWREGLDRQTERMADHEAGGLN